MSVSPSRRRLLQAALLAPVVTACTTQGSPDRGQPDPDAAIRASAIARERGLVDSYRAAAASSSSKVASKTAGLAEEHEEHLAALRAPAPTPAASSPPAAGSVPTLAELAAAERAAAGAHAAAALHASRPLAAVLASLAASEASHAVVLS